MQYFEVAPVKIVKADQSCFTYHHETHLPAGSLVVIPVGPNLLPGVVLKSTDKPLYPTKPVSAVINTPPIPKPLLQTALWMSEYYATHLALVLQTVLPSGLTKKRRAVKKNVTITERKRTHFLFNRDQEIAIKTLLDTHSGTAILHGVTGSGKTAVYIEYAKHIIESGKSIIVLVPEIALTTQLIGEFQHTFPDLIVTHSQQTEAQRHQAWLAALTETKPTVAIGPRSALFLPLQRIGAVIIDEAHEPAFKQDQSPRYSALRVAAVLARHHKAIVVQGSATPLVSEYYLAQKMKRPIIRLSKRAHNDVIKPTVTVVDMTTRANFLRHCFLSEPLLDEIKVNLTNRKQTLIYHNRRGSSSITLCKQCGWSALCQRCWTPFTLHIDRHALICHICGQREPIPTACPTCLGTDIIHRGIGTKLIESELKKFFPQAVIARFDGDTANKDSLHQRYHTLYDGSIDIIIGTQVVAKGLDLPHLRTVGVIQADAGLALPDFTTRERTFQLLAQVVGRVGRNDQPTSIIVQSYQPANSTIVYGINQDFDRFYKSELSRRRQGIFPPFVYLLKLTCIYKTEATAIKNSQAFARHIRSKHPNLTVFGPTPSFYERIRDTYRWQIVVKSTNRAELLTIINQLPSTHWQYDIDPANLL